MAGILTGRLGVLKGRSPVRMGEKIKKGEKKCLPVKNINIEVNKDTGVITMTNDGNGIDVACAYMKSVAICGDGAIPSNRQSYVL